MKRFLWVALLLPAFAVAIFYYYGGTTAIVRRALPRFPDYPPPTERLAEDQSGVVHFSTATPFDFDVLIGDMRTAIPTTGLGTLVMPEGASAAAPVPAMVLLHGSGGIKPGREGTYAAWLADHGIAAFVIDYYAPRGVGDDATSYMMRVISVTEFDAVTDAYAALGLLSTHPAIDAARIGVMGFSYGGMAARFAMDERIRTTLNRQHPGFAAFVDYYGPCFQNLGTAALNGAPLLTLRGDDDASNDLAACRQREEELRALGAEVEAHVYAGAAHAWEVDTPRTLHEDLPYVVGCQIDYDLEGHSKLGDQYIVNLPPDTDRATRIANRLSSGTAMSHCVKNGYIIGHDPDTKAKSDAALLTFLERTLK